jgi:hypothetical protein
MKHYYTSTTIEEGMPEYMFVLRAQNSEQAEMKAHKIIKKDYPEHYKFGLANDIYVEEVTAESLLKLLTLNLDTNDIK